MDIGIVGSTGYIAQFLIEHFETCSNIAKVVKFDKSDLADIYLDLQDCEKFNFDLLDGLSYLIFTAAISGPDMCAKEYEMCWNINVIGTTKFISEAIKRNIRVLFFSSDAVFGDIDGFIYNEKSETMAKTPYGRMKKAVEDEFKQSAYFKAIRLSYVASSKDRFVSYCMSCMEKGEIADVYHPFYRNCIVVSDVVKVVEWMINNWEEFTDFVLNVAGNELISRVRIADEINRIKKGKLKYTISVPDESFYQNRPSITQMESLYLYDMNILKRESFTTKIQREMENE